MRTNGWRLAVALVLAAGLIGLVAGCGDTWSGLKQDTRENAAAVGRGIEKGGQKIQESVE